LRQVKVRCEIEKIDVKTAPTLPPPVRGDTVTYVGLGIGALCLVVTVVGLGDKGFQTMELQLVGPSIILSGVLIIILRVLYCVITRPDIRVQN